MLKNFNCAVYKIALRTMNALPFIPSVFLLAGCSFYNEVTQRVAQSVTPYQITVGQGNFVSSEEAAQLRRGMTRDHVRGALGTPLLTDIFHANRWDYLFYIKRGRTQIVQQRHLILYFEQDQLTHWTGTEDLPSEYELIAEIDHDKRANTRGKQRSSVKR